MRTRCGKATFRWLTITIGLALATNAMANSVSMTVDWAWQDTLASTISDSNKWAWSETTGWINFAPETPGWYEFAAYHTAGSNGYFSGYAWGENIGWIQMSANANGPFPNSSATNWGVNVAADGKCSGFAYSSHTGWINFDPTHEDVTMQPTNGVFDGYAWGENIGWIHFQNATPAYKVQRGTTGTLRLWWLTLQIRPIGFVSVAQAGNDDCAYEDAQCGAVNYEYRMGELEVSSGQYALFLNAVATSDPHGLYNPNMWDSDYGCKIERHGESGAFSYSVADDRAARPVNFVSWGDAGRFANWLSNGQPIGPQDDATTEDGSYALHGAMTDPELIAVSRKPPSEGGRYYIPSEDEWYKSAYYDPDKPGGPGYWRYPTYSDEAPGNDLLPDDPGNSANCLIEPDDYTLGAPYYRSACGAFSNSYSPYGTFDQGGNVWEWNETIFEGDKFGLRGGAYDSPERDLNPARDVQFPSTEAANVGFRISEISMLSGRVFEGDVGVEATPLAGVTVSLYGSTGQSPDTNNFIASTTTDTNGWYQLNASGNWPWFQIHQADPPGYFSAGATSVSGLVFTVNCISMESPLAGKILTGNKFWDKQGDTKAADLGIRMKRVSPTQEPIAHGATIQYNVTVWNYGAHSSSNSIVTLTLPWQIDYDSAAGSPVVVSNDPDVIQWSLGDLALAGTIIWVQGFASSNASGGVISSASVAADSADYHQQNNSCTHTDIIAGEVGRDMGQRKWLQPPDLTTNGIDIRLDRADGVERLMADDFLCTNISQITGVDLWGSWSNDYRPGQIQSVHLAIYDDIPTNESPTGYSMPGNLLWQRDFSPGEFAEELYYRLKWEDHEWWWDPDADVTLPNGDQQVWRVSITNLNFVQYGTSNAPAVYWLGGWVELAEGGCFGWKTSSNQWNDSAVRWDVPSGEWRTLQYPLHHTAHSNAIDLAFAVYERPFDTEMADLSVSLYRVSPTNDPVTPGGQVDYFFEVWNNGPDTAENAVVTFELPPEMSYSNSLGGIVISNNPDVVQWTFSNYPPGSLSSFRLWGDVATNAAGSVTSKFSAVSDTLDPIATNDLAQHTSLVGWLDFGDIASEAFPTLMASNGARHIIVPGFYLGEGVDADADGQPNGGVSGDDADGNDDEDGVTFPSTVYRSWPATVEVVSSQPGVLDAWITFDGNLWDGDDRIFTNQALVAGTNLLNFTVPSDAMSGHYVYCRFRLSSAGVPSYDGLAPDGEVEDYFVYVAEPMLQGRVFQGVLGIETNPLANVTVSLYGSLNTYPDMGTLITNTVTDSNGWYGFTLPTGWDFYNIVETDPPSHTSVGATSVDGAVRTSNWIEHAHPLLGKTLTGNKFWDEPIPPSYGWLEGAVTDYELPGDVPTCNAAVLDIEPGGITVPVDPTNGYYGPIALTSGVYNLTATASGYATQTISSVGIVDGITTTQDIALKRPVIDVSPLSFTGITVFANEGVTNFLTITNSGHKPLELELREETNAVAANVLWFSQNPIQATINGSGHQEFDIVFVCTTVGVHTCTLRIIHNDPAEGSFEIPVAVNCIAPPPTEDVKWQQSPDFEIGLDIQSWGLEHGSPSGTRYRVADDWLCDGRPIDGIRWWGSYVGCATSPPPAHIRPEGFVLRWYTDIPAVQTNHSMPGALLEEVFVPLAAYGASNTSVGTVQEMFAFTADLSPLDPLPSLSQEHEYSYQVMLLDPWLEKEGNIYWLSVEARYETEEPSGGVWGWATANPHANWNDDAVLSRDEEPPVWVELVYPPQVSPWIAITNHPYAGDSVNMAFELITKVVGRRAKHWAQAPDMLEGVDMSSWQRDGGQGELRADDFMSDGRRITDIHWWGSYIGWQTGMTGDEANRVAPPMGTDRPLGFDVSWHSHSNGAPGTGTSLFVSITNCHEMYFGTIEQDWLGTNHYEHEYQYYVDLLDPVIAAEPWNCQQSQHYWLNIQALFPPSFDPTNHQGWGWVTGDRVDQDSSVVSTNGGRTWDTTLLPLGHPRDGQSFDLAFEMTTDAVGTNGPYQPIKCVEIVPLGPDALRIESIGDYGSGVQILQGINSLWSSNWTGLATNPLPLPPPYLNIWFPHITGSNEYYRILQR